MRANNTLKISRSPSPKQEHAYYEWGREFFDRRCDHCGAWTGEVDVEIHDVAGKPRTVYCSEYCYHREQHTVPYQREEI